MKKSNPRIAAIDLGSNSAHLVIAEADGSGSFRVLDTEKVNIRLADYFDKNRSITEEGIQKTVHALQQIKEIALAYTDKVRVVATYATRVATNQNILLQEVFKKTGLKIEVISGHDEARLEFLGVQQGLPLKGPRTLLLDIGGGSSELMIADSHTAKFIFASSLPFGAVTMSNQFAKELANSNKSCKALDKYLESYLAPVVKGMRGVSKIPAIASSGTAKALATVCARIFEKDDLSDPNGFVFSTEQAEFLYGEFLKIKSPEKIKDVFGVDLRRAQILPAGTAILCNISRACGIKHWMVSTYSLREGLVVDSFRAMGLKVDARTESLRWRHVLSFGAQMHIDQDFATCVAQLTLSIYDGVMRSFPEFRSDAYAHERELLLVAAYLCECGKAISFSRYHKHSAYVIANGELMSFTQREKFIISSIIRFHRRNFVSKNRPLEFPSLMGDEQRVNFLAGCLRLGISMNRSRQGRVKDVRVSRFQGEVIDLCLTIRGSFKDAQAELQHVANDTPAVAKAWRSDFRVRVRRG